MSRLIKQMDFLLIRACRSANPECKTNTEAIQKEIDYQQFIRDRKLEINADHADNDEMIETLAEILNQIQRN